ncbi:hypothetical protein R3W88_001271 [Solanum pinnatisectum]|uniref:Secreted protein n=1 Tax=Solanum pinnatisectum TaxID=50273 RepID=A0AAV9MHZ2_9SOLN|nr:hypothetical protein R3W88_001271 [Solanum pinnatisectum]
MGSKHNLAKKVLHQMLLSLLLDRWILIGPASTCHGLFFWPPVDAPVLSEIPLLVPFTVHNGTNFKRPMDPLNLVPNVTPTSMVPLTAPFMALSSASDQVPQLMFPLRTPQMVPLVDL